jgi:SAM-dependent methyltransferase
MFPSSQTRDSALMYARMEEVAFELLGVGPGARVLDAAAGIGQDARALAARGIRVFCAEPSRPMMQLGAYLLEKDGDRLGGEGHSRVLQTRAWAEALPFADGAFDAVLCKGALDHFDDPLGCIGELARVTRAGGRVVLVVANMGSLAQRVAQGLERWSRRRASKPGRRHHDVPADHYTRYDASLLRAHVREHLVLERWVGVSLFWGLPRWGRLLGSVDAQRAAQLFRGVDRAARWFPSGADVIVAAGRPRAAAS